MDWRDIAAIVFVCTAVNHLGLIGTIERIIRHPLPIVNCPRCLTCWSVMAYGIATLPFYSPMAIAAALPGLLAISLLCSYTAIWLELTMYAIDTLYNKIYGIIENIGKEDCGKDRTENE